MKRSGANSLIFIVLWTTMSAGASHADDFGELQTGPPKQDAAPLFLKPEFRDWVRRLIDPVGKAEASAPPGPAEQPGVQAEERQPPLKEAQPQPQQPPPQPPPKQARPAPRIDEEPARRARTTAAPSPRRPFQRGLAAWYKHPGKTASGERFNPNALTAAHSTLPFGARVQVVSEETGRRVTVRVNDRISRKAKARKNLAIELSRRGAQEIGMSGVSRVSIYRN